MKFHVYVCVECGHKIARTQKVHSGQYIDDVRVQVRKSEFRMEVLSGTPVDDDDAKPSKAKQSQAKPSKASKASQAKQAKLSKAKPSLSNLFWCQNVFCCASVYFGSFNFFVLEHVFWFVVLVCLGSFNFFVLQHVFWFVVLVCLGSFNFFVLQHVFPVFCGHVSVQRVPREGL